MNIFEAIYIESNLARFSEMSAEKALDIIKSADNNSDKYKNGNRHVAKNINNGLVLTTKTDADKFSRLYNKSLEKYHHWTEDGAELHDISDFIKEFYKKAKELYPNDLTHLKLRFLEFVSNLDRNAFPIDIGYKAIPKPEKLKNGTIVYRPSIIDDKIAIELMVEDYFLDAEHELTGLVPEKIRWELKNIRRWKNGEIIVLDSKTNNQIDYKSKHGYV